MIAGLVPALLAWQARAWPYNESLVDYNFNQNQTATNPADYWGQWPNHTGDYYPSPDNWRFPFYTLMLDRFVNGDPTNDNFNKSVWEHDLWSTQMRHGGDVVGLVDTLDYLQGMGIKVGGGTSFRGWGKAHGIVTLINWTLGHLSRRYHSDESALGLRWVFCPRHHPDGWPLWNPGPMAPGHHRNPQARHVRHLRQYTGDVGSPIPLIAVQSEELPGPIASNVAFVGWGI